MRANGTRSRHALLAVITASVFIPTGLPAQRRPGFCTASFVFCYNCAITISVVTRKDTPCVMGYRAGDGAIFGLSRTVALSKRTSRCMSGQMGSDLTDRSAHGLLVR